MILVLKGFKHIVMNVLFYMFSMMFIPFALVDHIRLIVALKRKRLASDYILLFGMNIDLTDLQVDGDVTFSMLQLTLYSNESCISFSGFTSGDKVRAMDPIIGNIWKTTILSRAGEHHG